MTTTAVRTADEVSDLPRGTRFSIRLTKSMSWRDLHRTLYYTANREVTLTLRDGTKITGTLDETPGYFSRGTKAGPRVWLRVAGRKTRKPVDPFQIRHWVGYRAPTLAEAYTALIYLNASSPTADQVAESLSIAKDM
jgi:hypothetical protein